MSTQELDRSVLDAKDREELHAIAGAMGVKAPTRMRKGELIDAILDAAEGESGSGDQPGATSSSSDTASDDDRSASRPRTVRSARASELERDSVAALAAEEDALASADDPADEPAVTPRPQRSTSERESGPSGTET